MFVNTKYIYTNYIHIAYETSSIWGWVTNLELQYDYYNIDNHTYNVDDDEEILSDFGIISMMMST